MHHTFNNIQFTNVSCVHLCKKLPNLWSYHSINSQTHPKRQCRENMMRYWKVIEITLPLLEGSTFDMSILTAVHLALCLASPIHAGGTTCINAWKRLVMPTDYLHLQLVIVIKRTRFHYNLDLCEWHIRSMLHQLYKSSQYEKQKSSCMDIPVWKGHCPSTVGEYIEIVIIVVGG